MNIDSFLPSAFSSLPQLDLLPSSQTAGLIVDLRPELGCWMVTALRASKHKTLEYRGSAQQ